MRWIDFLRSERASVSTEAVVTIPILVFLYAAAFVWWDGYRTAMVAQKASFTVSDVISREPATIDQAYINGMNQMFDFLTDEAGTTSIRVSVVRQVLGSDGVTEELELRWSNVAGSKFAPHADLTVLTPHVPVLGLGDEMIMVETHMVWDPLAGTGVVPSDAYTIVATSPRFANPQMIWTGT